MYVYVCDIIAIVTMIIVALALKHTCLHVCSYIYIHVKINRNNFCQQRKRKSSGYLT